MKNQLFILLLSFTFVWMACPPNDEEVQCLDAQEFELLNFSDLDGCQWLLSSPAFDFRIEPTNLGDFVNEPFQGMKINVEVEFRDDLGSICMAGRIAEILCISD